MKPKKLTRESARKAKACYSDQRIARLVPDDGLTPRQVAELTIPLADRLWALFRATGATKTMRRRLHNRVSWLKEYNPCTPWCEYCAIGACTKNVPPRLATARFHELINALVEDFER